MPGKHEYKYDKYIERKSIKSTMKQLRGPFEPFEGYYPLNDII